MKQKYMLFMMISSPRQPENDTDVYLSLLIEDLKLLWDQGIEVSESMQFFISKDENPIVGSISY